MRMENGEWRMENGGWGMDGWLGGAADVRGGNRTDCK